jgi:glyceraldehyde 3-phosphate dehydrogenase
MNKKIKVGLNGLGRIGRHIFKMCIDDPLIELVGINELNPDLNNWAYTLNYDSIYGQAKYKSKVKNEKITCNKKSIFTSINKEISKVPWEEWGTEIIIDSSGVLENISKSRQIISNGFTKKVIFTNSPDEVDFTMILGVNQKEYNPDIHHLIASSICDATAIAPVSKIIDNLFKINNGYVTTLHPWLSYQNLMDGPSSSWSVPGEVYHHYALGRSAIGNMIPKPTSAIDAVFRVLPNMSKNIGSFSYRTPTQIIGSADLTLFVDKKTNKEEIIEAFKTFQKSQDYPILKITNSPLVSMDYIGEKYSAIVDTRWLDVIDSRLIKIVLWYDNEYGYCCNVMNQLKFINSLL